MTHTSGVGSLGSLAGLTTVQEKRNDAVKPQGVMTPVKLDQASLSVAGGLAAQSGTDVRLDKVQALQTAIANGTYNVPAAAVASKMVDSLLE